MNRCITLSALVTLFVQAPDKFMADRAKRGLREKGGCELVTLDMVDFGLFDSSSAVVQRKESFILKFAHVLCVWGEREREGGCGEALWWLQLGGEDWDLGETWKWSMLSFRGLVKTDRW